MREMIESGKNDADNDAATTSRRVGDNGIRSAVPLLNRPHHHHCRAVSHASPQPRQSKRRTIFPMLHGHRISSSDSDAAAFKDDTTPMQNYLMADSHVRAVRRSPARVRLRARSLDRTLSIPSVPKSSLHPTNGNDRCVKTNKELLDAIIPVPKLARDRQGHHPLLRRDIRTAPAPPTRVSRDCCGKQPTILGNSMRDRPYFYLVTTPPVVANETLSTQSRPTPMNPPPSILCKKRASSQCRSSSSLCSDECCSELTPASPASNTALRIADSEHVLECLPSDLAKALPHIPTPSLTMSKSRSESFSSDERQASSHHRRHSIDSSCHSLPKTRHVSFECMSRNKRVIFDPSVTVHEFVVTNFEKKGGGKWWTVDELEGFKREAIDRIRARSAIVIPTGTGRSLTVPTKCSICAIKGNISFNHPALGCDDEYDPELRSERVNAIMGHLSQEIRSILVVDPHPIFLTLFRKSLKHMIPHAAVASARSTEEALIRIEAAQRAFPVREGGPTHGFDVLIIEENLSGVPPTRQEDVSAQSAGDDSVQRFNMASGSSLICHLAESQRLFKGMDGKDEESRVTLLIGVSARLVDHRVRLEMAGADIVWGKPPPEMNAMLRNSLLRTLMKKRGRRIDFKLFDC